MKAKATLEMISRISKIPAYKPGDITALMQKLNMDERSFALVMNVTPCTIRLWTSGAARPSGTAKRLMQVYETCPEWIGRMMKDNDVIAVAGSEVKNCRKKSPKG